MAMRIVVTGANGFIGKNLCIRLIEENFEVFPISRQTSGEDVNDYIQQADLVIHLAGINRPIHTDQFSENQNITRGICETLSQVGKPVPIIFASSTQALLNNPYGVSKLAAEKLLIDYGNATGAPVHILRLTNVFGKWARPSYNSVIATFCHNLANDLPIQIDNPNSELRLLYIDDLIEAFLEILKEPEKAFKESDLGPIYLTTVGETAEMIRSFKESCHHLTIPRVGKGLLRALYSTYVSYLAPMKFDYQLPKHSDSRGEFVEMLKTSDSGQISYFTAHPGVTRGNHYHHSKTEKFLVIKGVASFKFRHILTNEIHEIIIRGGHSRVVETVPGWSHNITNIGDDELVVMLWANEKFDSDRPDTIAMEVDI
jgi:UDP-2-acetamido-2,6-beta-L-arabino-hexul-4-ose reductase